MNNVRAARLVRAVSFSLVVVLAGCSNPVSSETHVRPTGFEISVGGQPLVAESNGALTGSLTLVVNQQLGPATVQFRSPAGPVMPATDYFLEIEFANGAIVQFTPASPGGFTGTFRGLAPGATTMRVRWMHGRVGSPRAHHDYQSVPVPVVVAAVSGP
jgi:hypothetical protein